MLENNYPKLHNAMWPGLVGKGPDSEPPIDLDTMLDLTAAARVNGRKFDGVDLFLCAPHFDIDSSDDDIKVISERIGSRGLVIGSLVAPVWEPTGGGSAMGSDAEHLRLQSSQVVHTRMVSTICWSHSARPSMYSRSQYHFPRGLWLSQPRP